MTGKTHMAIGIASGLAISYNQPLERQIFIVLASTLGSLIPDLDHPKAKLNQKLLKFKKKSYMTFFYLTISVLFFLLFYKKRSSLFLISGLAFFLLAFSKHRHFTHSLFGLLIFSYIAENSLSSYGLDYISWGLIVGYLSHIVADFFTPSGVALLYPLKTKFSSPLRIRTSGKGERVVFILVNLFSIFLFLYIIIFSKL